MSFFKLKCPQCNQVKRRLTSANLLHHRLTRQCPDCGTEMYYYLAGRSDRRHSLHPNYFDQGVVPCTQERRKIGRKPGARKR